MSDEFSDNTLPAKAYTTFDATSLKKMLIDRLSENSTFTDQVYEGSNMSAFIDVIAYSYHTLMYYLNRTSNESLFSESNIYENINRIVKLLNYNPIGYQTSTLSFQAYSTSDLTPGTYTIPRYTFVRSNDITYSTVEDISFTKSTVNNEELAVVGRNHLLYQGSWEESIPIQAVGQEFESHVILPRETETVIDHFNMHVYVFDVNTSRYYKYQEVPTLYSYGPEDKVFEKRLNENRVYEIKFGNGVTGAKLNPGDQIQLYYLKSMGEPGIVGPDFLNDLKIVIFSSETFTQIRNDTQPENINYINFDDLQKLYLTNTRASENIQPAESVEEIRRKAPLYFTSRDRLVTVNDYTTYIERNFGGILGSVMVVENEEFVDGHLRYMSEDVGITQPNLESRVMFGHLPYASTTTYNNVYIYAVPHHGEIVSTNSTARYLAESQRLAIINSIKPNKMISHEPILMDPIYVITSPCISIPGETQTVDLVDKTRLRIITESRTTRDSSAIKQEVVNILYKYFTNTKLGQLINLREIVDGILNVQGVDELKTYRDDVDLEVDGLSLGIWNPVYQTDFTTTTQNLKLPYYKYVTFYDIYDLHERIDII